MYACDVRVGLKRDGVVPWSFIRGRGTLASSFYIVCFVFVGLVLALRFLHIYALQSDCSGKNSKMSPIFVSFLRTDDVMDSTVDGRRIEFHMYQTQPLGFEHFYPIIRPFYRGSMYAPKSNQGKALNEVPT